MEKENLALMAAKHEVCAALHQVIHDLHDMSDMLLDDDKTNDNVTMQAIQKNLATAIKLFNIRMNL